MNLQPACPLRLVVAGTGTEIGKTYVAAKLVKELHQARRTLGLKPIESGYQRESSDARAISGDRLIEPAYALREPISPHLAAARENVQIDLQVIRTWVEEQERQHQPDVTVIETAGGLFTPLSHDQAKATTVVNLNLLPALGPCRWILVAPDRLGVLHDVIACLQAAGAAGEQPVAIAVTRPDGDPGIDNLQQLRRLSPVPVFCVNTEHDGLLELACR